MVALPNCHLPDMHCEAAHANSATSSYASPSTSGLAIFVLYSPLVSQSFTFSSFHPCLPEYGSMNESSGSGILMLHHRQTYSRIYSNYFLHSVTLFSVKISEQLSHIDYVFIGELPTHISCTGKSKAPLWSLKAGYYEHSNRKKSKVNQQNYD